jgi:hypothetical protein
MKNLYTFLILIFTIVCNAQIVNIPDVNFKAKLLALNGNFATDFNDNPVNVDANQDGQIQFSEALLIKKLDVNDTFQSTISHITNITGIEAFTNLESLNCSFNNLTTLNVSMLSQLKEVFCSMNLLTLLNITGLTNLEKIDYSYNSQIAPVDFTGLYAIKEVTLAGNQLSVLPNISPLSNLESLNCVYNNFTSLDLTPFSQLSNLNCAQNQLTSLNITGLNLKSIRCNDNPQLPSMNFNSFVNLVTLECYSNSLQVNLDLSNCSQLKHLKCMYCNLTNLLLNDAANLSSLYCDDNNLSTLILPGTNYNSLPFMQSINFSYNPNLYYLCVNDSMIDNIQNKINEYGYSDTCHVNSYCSFTPGSTFYTIQGNTKFDEDNNGCAISDMNYPNLKFQITNGTNNGHVFSNNSGNYTIPVSEETHTVTPILENPSYFNVSPTSAIVTFPTTASPFTQDFCVTANGIHNDLEIALLPIGVARPGFDVNYKIVYKNKGTNTQSGSVNLTFNDAVMDLIIANPTTTISNTNALSWNFSNLQPFETREIVLTMNLNSPMETPAVVGGDILSYTATVVGATDETATDNTLTLNQTVVNSYDPNDKTCLEGTTVAPSTVGKYVHYLIRFENTGTFAAQNIVVKDRIDTTKYDINSLIPLSSSAGFVTRIKNTNQVEFIFENINLPFDDADNDGYIAFKIKTKPTLLVGDTFSNSASIYFDYNFPIVTNTATTTIAVLGTTDFEFASVFNLFPVPTKNVLSISTKEAVKISSLSIYNSLGQLVRVITNPNETIDVSELKTGGYFIKIVSEKGTSSSKFVKE